MEKAGTMLPSQKYHLAPQHRKERRDKGLRLMTTRDKWILQWIADQYAIRFDHLQALLSRDPRTRNPACAPGPQGVTASNVGQVLTRWGRDPEWAEYRRIYTDTPGWIWVTPHCMQQVLGLSYAKHTLRESTLEHLHWINCVRLDIERRHPEYRWVSERMLRASLPRRVEGESVGHVPDAAIWTQNHHIAVEVELSPKPVKDIGEICRLLLTGNDPADSAVYTTIWYFVCAQGGPVQMQARRAVESARQRLPEELRSKIQIIDLEPLERRRTS